MNEKSATDTLVFDNFKKRFPTTDDFVNWLLQQPVGERLTAADLHARVAREREERLKKERGEGEPPIEETN